MVINFNLIPIEEKSIIWEEQEIKIKQYLPVGQKAVLVGQIINAVVDENGYWNPISFKVWYTINMVFAYTDIEIGEDNSLSGLEMYDYLISSGLWNIIQDYIPDSEIEYIKTAADITIDNIYAYKNSALGIMQSIADNYEDLNLDAEEIREKLANPDNLATLKEVLEKMG